MQIIWDEPKRQANLAKHGLDFADLSLTFFEEAIIRPAKLGRLAAFGRFADGTIAVVFCNPGFGGAVRHSHASGQCVGKEAL